jgi:hypothetical protein
MDALLYQNDRRLVAKPGAPNLTITVGFHALLPLPAWAGGGTQAPVGAHSDSPEHLHGAAAAGDID